MLKELFIGGTVVILLIITGLWVPSIKSSIKNRFHKTPAPTAQTATETPSGTASLSVLAVREGKDIVVAYKNIPAEAKYLFLCTPDGACTEWGVPFSPKDTEGTFVMTHGAGSTKTIGHGTFVVSATADPFRVLFSSPPFTN